MLLIGKVMHSCLCCDCYSGSVDQSTRLIVENEVSVEALKAVLLAGGASRRMGQDKALMPHPGGGVWLTALVRILQHVGLPVTVLTRHASHAQVLSALAGVEMALEPEPWKGPLMALGKVLSDKKGSPLLVCPVDMPLLTVPAVQLLIEAWIAQPDAVAVADDGERLQPLLAIIPSGPPVQPSLQLCLESGELRWLTWLSQVPHQRVRLPVDALVNLNGPEDLSALVP